MFRAKKKAQEDVGGGRGPGDATWGADTFKHWIALLRHKMWREMDQSTRGRGGAKDKSGWMSTLPVLFWTGEDGEDDRYEDDTRTNESMLHIVFQNLTACLYKIMRVYWGNL
jgi:hypothetical protein